MPSLHEFMKSETERLILLEWEEREKHIKLVIKPRPRWMPKWFWKWLMPKLVVIEEHHAS